MNRTFAILLFASGALFAGIGVVAFRSFSESAVVESAAPSPPPTQPPPLAKPEPAVPISTTPDPTGTSAEKSPAASLEKPVELSIALPIAKVDVLAELRKRGYELEPQSLQTPQPGAEAYGVNNTTARITFIERDGRLVLMIVAFARAAELTPGERSIEFLESVGEIATGLTRDQARHATAQGLLDLGTAPTDSRRFVGYTQDRVLVRFRRLANGDPIIVFMPSSVLGLW